MRRVEYNVHRAINTIPTSADKCMLDNTVRMSITAKNINKWRLDMLQCLTNVHKEIDLLLVCKKKIQAVQKALTIICSISTECLDRRSFRLEIDLSLDPGQMELIKVSNYQNP